MKTEKHYVFIDKPTPNCHASTLELLPGKSIAFAWFGGEREGTDDVGIWFAKYQNGRFTTPIEVSCEKSIPHWNPVLFLRDDGVLCLYYKVGKEIPYWQTMVMYSDDNGQNWSKPKLLVENDVSGGRGPVKNKILKLSNNTLASPASTEQGNWKAFVDLSYDNGENWEKQMIIPTDIEYGDKPVQTIQPTLWESETGNIHMLLRTDSGFAYRSDSGDFGKTWTKAYKTTVLNNNSGLDVDKAGDGNLYLVSNPVSKSWGLRTPLLLSKSTDNGKNFEPLLVLENENGEYSYPAIICRGNMIYICYTYNRDTIAFWEIEI